MGSIINPRRAYAVRVTVVGSVWCVCVSVQHLTSRVSFRPENAVTYSTGNEGQKNCGVFSETASLRRSSIPFVVRPAYSAKPKATCNTSQCETATYLSLSAALVSASCLSIFRIRSVTRNSLRLLPGYIPYTSVTRAI